MNKKKKSPGFSGYKDAVKNKLRVGIISGNSYHDSFWGAFPYRDAKKTRLNKQLDPAPNLETNLKKLARMRIDLFPADITVGRVTLARLGFQDKISWYEKPLFSKGYPMPFAKKSNYPELKYISEQFEKELIAMKKDGTYEKIRSRWFK